MTALLARALLADPVLQLPDTERGEEEAFRASKRADGGLFSGGGILDVVFPRTTTARFGFPGTTRGLAYGEMASVVHAR